MPKYTREEVLARVIKVTGEQLGIPESSVTDESMFTHEDLNMDSLDTIELIMAIEDEFDIEIEDEKADRVEGIKDTVDLLMADYLNKD